jgi:signal transduction histidine kinase
MNVMHNGFNEITADDFVASLPFGDHPLWLPEIVKNPPIQLAYVLAHEVRNPLTNINLAADTLNVMVKDEEISIYLDIIKRNAARINDLITDLLNYGKDDKPASEKYEVTQLLDEVLYLTTDRLLLKNITVVKDFTDQPGTVYLNPEKMIIALTNIIINAIEAMTPEKGELKLITKSMPYGYLVQIEDNGCGISKANLENIFLPWFTSKPGGQGLGLASTYDILRANGVKIKCDSLEGIGTRFLLLFEEKKLFAPMTTV